MFSKEEIGKRKQRSKEKELTKEGMNEKKIK